MKSSWIIALASVACTAEAASGQRLLGEWHARTTAGAEALVTGAPAVFWNPAQVSYGGPRGEAVLMDLRAPGATGVNGVALAGAGRLNTETTFALGYQHVGVDGITQTTMSPEGGLPLVVAEDRFAAAAAHALNPRLTVGALVQYTRLPQFSDIRGVVALGAGARYRPVERIPLSIAGMAATEGEEAYWMAGVDYTSAQLLADWIVRGEYGAAGRQLGMGVTHRVTATGEWRRQAEFSAGAVVAPDGVGRSVQPILGGSVRYHRYRLGVVREQLPNEFGGVYSFRFGVSF